MTSTTVDYPDGYRVTRLPVGRAAGKTWVVFIVEGPEPGDNWYRQNRIRFLDAAEREIQIVGGGGGGADDLWLEHLSLDARQFTIRYVHKNATLTEESVSL